MALAGCFVIDKADAGSILTDVRYLLIFLVLLGCSMAPLCARDEGDDKIPPTPIDLLEEEDDRTEAEEMEVSDDGADDVPVFDSVEKMRGYIGKELQSYPAHLALRFKRELGKKEVSQCMSVVRETFGPQKYRYGYSGNLLRIDIKWRDAVLMVAIHQGLLPETRLSGRQREAYRKACDIVKELRSQHSGDCELALALHDYIVQHARYKSHDRRMGEVTCLLLQGLGVCTCYARTYYTLCTMAGLECRCVRGRTRGAHSWNMVKIEGKWVHVDCTLDDLSRRQDESVSHIYFGLPDDVIAATHRWERDAHPRCTTDEFWHAKNKMEQYDTLDEFFAAYVEALKAGSGTVSLTGYVREVAEHPGRLKATMRKLGKKYRVRYWYNYPGQGHFKAFLTLTNVKPKK